KKTNELPILRALILVPTRELATQIAKAVDDYAKYLEVNRVTVFGGVSIKEQTRKIERGVDILVATSGRLLEHIKNGTVNLTSVSTVVIDEVDTMLDMGFLEDIEKILPNIGPHRQIMMFSATMNQNVKKLAKEFLTDPVVIEVAKQRSAVKIIDQQIILVDEDKKAELLSYLIGSRNYSQVLVFVNMKIEADDLVAHLELDGLPAACIHGDVRQTARAKALRKFKSGDIRVLVATDIAARGIDIELLPVVVNFALPEAITDYTHRIGRTGRAGNAGTAITLLSVKDYKFMIEIEKELIINIPRTQIEGFETTEKKPRLFKARPKQLSVKKAEAKKSAQKTGFAKTNTPKKPPAKKKKTTKRDDNRSFRK
ncbi:MAG: DEAD/DEAH box helicase, partial [Aliarcobacter sp.]